MAAGAGDLSAAFAAMTAAGPVFHVTDLVVADHHARLSDGPRRLIGRGTPRRRHPRFGGVAG